MEHARDAGARWWRRLMKPLVFLVCLVPFAQMTLGAFADTLGANPIQAITSGTGTWTLRFLVITLAVTPLRRLTGWHGIIRLRRMLGLFAFFYGTAHLFTYLWLDQFFDLPAIAGDVMKRPFITAGFTGFVLMLPLALTSTSGMIRRLGGRRWQLLHRLIYVAAAAGVVHYWWLVKADLLRPQVYAGLVASLLALRLVAGGWRRLVRSTTVRLRPGSEHAGV